MKHRRARGVGKVPLHCVCDRPACGQVFTVRRPIDQRRRRFCSHRCAAIVHQNIRGAGQKGGTNSGAARRRRLLAQLEQLTPLQAFRLGYDRGLQSKLRQIRKRFVLVDRKGRAA